MKTYRDKKLEKANFYEVIMPIPGFGVVDNGGEDGFHDDCPLCQEMKARVDRGEIEEVDVDLDAS